MKKEEKAPVYILCPRCDLNYIGKKDKLCNVCKAEIGLIDPSILIPDDELAGEKLCPICSVNYIAEDEEICFLCVKERDDKNSGKEGWGFEADEDTDNDSVIVDIPTSDDDDVPFDEEIPFIVDEEMEEELDEEMEAAANVEDDFEFEEYTDDDFEDYDEDEDFDDDDDDDDF